MGNLSNAIRQRITEATKKKHPAKLAWWREKLLKVQDDDSLKEISVNGLTFYYKSRFTMYHTYPDIFVREMYKFDVNDRKPVIIDCGGNIGLSVLYFASHYQDAEIITYEPDSANYEILQKNVQENFPLRENITLLQSAVWKEDGEISFFADGSEASSISIERSNTTEVKVQAVRLKSVLQRYTVIDFLKMDIEGAEYEVVKDCKDELHRINNFFLEYHGTVEDTFKLRELTDIVTDAGFYIYISLAAELIEQPFYQKKSGDSFDVQLNIFCYRK